MNALSAGAALFGALLSPTLLIRRIGKRGRGVIRGAIHLMILTAFAVAGGAHARAGGVWSAFGIVAIGALWSGTFAILSIRSRSSPSRGEIMEPDTGPVGEGGVAPEAREELEPGGRALLKRLLDLERTRVGDMTVPREKIVHAELSGGVSEVLAKIRATGHLRIPMADGSLDRIVGIAYAKDLIPHVLEGGPTPPLKGLVRRPLFVPADRPASSLLELFRTHRGHLAIVVDEYNRTVGLVTRDDVFRTLAGSGEGSA
jgi:CBS domain containing-hemolysin-like protein